MAAVDKYNMYHLEEHQSLYKEREISPWTANESFQQLQHSKFFALLHPLVLYTLPCSIIQRGKHERSEVQRIINYFLIYCQQQLFTSLNNKQLLSVWTTALHKEVSQISLEMTQLRTAYVPCSSLYDTSSSKRKKKRLLPSPEEWMKSQKVKSKTF